MSINTYSCFLFDADISIIDRQYYGSYRMYDRGLSQIRNNFDIHTGLELVGLIIGWMGLGSIVKVIHDHLSHNRLGLLRELLSIAYSDCQVQF